ncbi:MAG: FtsX-like permease family protein, partial [Acidobacteriaceae bacterium]|nr:FtsX-like permease family protein [Acidobacteriaceae bacterium]
RATPGIRAAATSAVMPGAAGELEGEFKIDTQLTHTGKKIVADSRWVSNSYFETMRIPLLTGEGCPRALVSAAIVNRAFANTFFEGLSPVGHYLQPVPNPFNIPPARIIGIAADAREEGLNREPLPTVYSCISAPNPFPLYLIRTQGDPMALAQTIRRKIHQIEPARSVYDISPLEQHLSDNFAETRLRTTLLTLFALTAVSLACVGLYGTLSYFVSVRKREIGLRLALGAMREQIVSSFLLRGVSVAVIGCLVGLLLAAALTHTLAGMLYGVSPLDFETFLGVPLVILLVTAVSAFAPALGAARVDAIQVLRDE